MWSHFLGLSLQNGYKCHCSSICSDPLLPCPEPQASGLHTFTLAPFLPSSSLQATGEMLSLNALQLLQLETFRSVPFSKGNLLYMQPPKPESEIQDSFTQNLHLSETTGILPNAYSYLYDRHGILCFMRILPFHSYSRHIRGLLRVCPFTNEEAEAEFKPLLSKGPGWLHSHVLSVFRLGLPLYFLIKICLKSPGFSLTPYPSFTIQ